MCQLNPFLTEIFVNPLCVRQKNSFFVEGIYNSIQFHDYF